MKLRLVFPLALAALACCTAVGAITVAGGTRDVPLFDTTTIEAARKAVELLSAHSGGVAHPLSLCTIKRAQAQVVAGVKYYLDLVVVDTAGVQQELNLTLYARPWLEGDQQEGEEAYQLLSQAVVKSPLSPAVRCTVEADPSDVQPNTGGTANGGGGKQKQPLPVDDPDALFAAQKIVELMNDQDPISVSNYNVSLCSLKSVEREELRDGTHYFLDLVVVDEQGVVFEAETELLVRTSAPPSNRTEYDMVKMVVVASAVPNTGCTYQPVSPRTGGHQPRLGSGGDTGGAAMDVTYDSTIAVAREAVALLVAKDPTLGGKANAHRAPPMLCFINSGWVQVSPAGRLGALLFKFDLVVMDNQDQAFKLKLTMYTSPEDSPPSVLQSYELDLGYAPEELSVTCPPPFGIPCTTDDCDD